MTAPATGTGRTEVERLTSVAASAAEQGQWELVDECYRAREAALSGVALSSLDIERLLNIDRRVQTQAIVARAAVAAQLREAFATRLSLKGLRSGIGESGGCPGTLRMKA